MCICESQPLSAEKKDAFCLGCLTLTLVRFVSIETCGGKYDNNQNVFSVCNILCLTTLSLGNFHSF